MTEKRGETMKTHVLTGSKAEIVENVARIDGVIREVIVFVEEASDAVPATVEEMFAEMEPYTVKVDAFVDDSREGIYTRMEGE
jgi:alanine dehydrogenase